MLGGFGAIKAMQDSIKMNRSQLKRHRKSARELSESHPARGLMNEVSDSAKVEAVRNHIIAKRKRERRFSIALIIMFAMLGIWLMSLLFK